MTLPLFYAEKALADLDDIYDFIAPDNPARAETYIDDIRKACRSLCESPLLGVARPGKLVYDNVFYLIRTGEGHMEPLHDRTGQVYAWLDTKTERILDLRGKHIAFMVGDSVYDWSGHHIGWWQDGHMRDNRGAVVVFCRDATNLIVGRPGLGGIPGRPGKAGVPGRPGLAGKPGRPGNAGAWSRDMPF